VATSYYEILYLLESETLLTRALEMNLAQSKLAKTKRSAGFTGETDVLEFELREATIKSDLKRLEKERTSQLRDLARLLGRPLEAQLPTVHGHLARPAKPLQKEALTDALDSNPEIVRAKAEHEGRVLDLKTAVSSFLPTVDLEGRYGKLADEDAVSKKSNDYHLALKVNVPIFAAGENTSNLRSARAQSARSEIETERLRDRIRREAQDLLEEAQSLRERLALEERNLERSESYYKLSLNEYKRGIKNSPDVVGASERLLETKLRNLEFRRDIALNRLKVQEIQGSMEIPAD
ncbi:MAG TPA: TolC family protein, partial [Pseudobdellovibrionaceae bacterium]|nr:TolC family protein [Pseudobdellovibrionaceae bacterium]